jgi:nucleoside-diphosphate-sugar epimerase
VIAALEQGERRLPAIQFCTGRATTLGELARIANRAGGERSHIIERPQRSYDVTRFVGDPRRARALLGWQASIDISDGVRRLADDFALAYGRDWSSSGASQAAVMRDLIDGRPAARAAATERSRGRP